MLLKNIECFTFIERRYWIPPFKLNMCSLPLYINCQKEAVFHEQQSSRGYGKHCWRLILATGLACFMVSEVLLICWLVVTFFSLVILVKCKANYPIRREKKFCDTLESKSFLQYIKWRRRWEKQRIVGSKKDIWLNVKA